MRIYFMKITKIAYIFCIVVFTSILMHASRCPEDSKVSPHVTAFEWGKIEIGTKVYKDVRLWPDHSEEWNWGKTGTRHVPGIQISDLEDFIDEIDEIVLSEGVDGVLQTKPETLEYLEKAGKKIHKALTPEAIKIYNERAVKHVRIGALLHSTC